MMLLRTSPSSCISHHRRSIHRRFHFYCRCDHLDTRICLEISVFILLCLSNIIDSSTIGAARAVSSTSPPDCSSSHVDVFDDVVSRTFTSHLVIVGQLKRSMEDPVPMGVAVALSDRESGSQPHQITPTSPKPTRWTGVFLVKTILKDDSNVVVGGTSGSVSVGSRIVVTTGYSSSRCAVSNSTVTIQSADVWKKLLIVGSQYVVFVGERLSVSGSVDESRNGASSPRYACLGEPEKFSKNVTKLVKDNSCTGCGSSPIDARISPKTFLGKFGHPLELLCRTSGGRPSPVLRWFRDNEPLTASPRVEISSRGGRGSQLIIREAFKSDAGGYTCRAVNVFGSVTSSISTVAVAEPTSTNRQYSTLCPSQQHCLNQGTCYQLLQLNITYCECDHPWTGPRCMTYQVVESKPENMGAASMGVSISTIILGVLVVLVLSMLFYLIFIVEKLRKAVIKLNKTSNAPEVNGGYPVRTDVHSQRQRGSSELQSAVVVDKDGISESTYAVQIRTSKSGPYENGIDFIDGRPYTMERCKTDSLSGPSRAGRSRLTATSITPEPPLTPCVDRMQEAESAAARGLLYTAQPSARNSPPTSRAVDIVARQPSSTLPASANGGWRPNRDERTELVSPVPVGAKPSKIPLRSEQTEQVTSECNQPLLQDVNRESATIKRQKDDNEGDEDDGDAAMPCNEKEALCAMLQEITAYDSGTENHINENHRVGIRSCMSPKRPVPDSPIFQNQSFVV